MNIPGTGLVIFVVASLIAPFTGAAQESARGLRLQIGTPRESYVLGEPVYLTARLVNQGPGEIRFMPLLNPKDGLLTVSIRDSAGRGVGFVPLSSRDRDGSPVTLAPNGELGMTFPVFFGASGWVFKTPGRFTAVAQFEVHSGPGEPQVIQSNSVDITIRDEFGEGGRFLMDGAAGLEAGRFLVWRSGDQLEQGLTRLRQYSDRYPTSPVVDHYRVALGRMWARPFKDYRKGAVRPADYARALAELDPARDDVLPPFVQVEKYLTRAASFLGAGRTADASEPLQRARTLIGDRAELLQFREQLERLARATVPRS